VPLSLNDLGGVAFGAVADGTSGVWVKRGNRLIPVAISGQPAPGTAGTFQTPASPALNNTGGIAFVDFGVSASGVYWQVWQVEAGRRAG
jgi:hypothetical protein